MNLRRNYNHITKSYEIELFVKKRNSNKFVTNPNRVFKEISNSLMGYDDQYKLFVDYMNLLNKTRNQKNTEVAKNLLIHLLSTKMSCDSKILIAYIYIRRQSKDLESMSVIIKLCEDLKIHRCSFKTFATILTTYATNAMEANSRMKSLKDDIEMEEMKKIVCLNVQSIEGCLEYFLNKLKYHPNTYLFNFVLNTYNKLGLKEKFWEFYIDVAMRERKSDFKEENKIVFDLYTWCSLFQQCIDERNAEKFDLLHEKFDSKEFSYNTLGFYKSLKRKMSVIKKEQINDGVMHEKAVSDNIWKPLKSKDRYKMM